MPIPSGSPQRGLCFVRLDFVSLLWLGDRDNEQCILPIAWASKRQFLGSGDAPGIAEALQTDIRQSQAALPLPSSDIPNS